MAKLSQQAFISHVATVSCKTWYNMYANEILLVCLSVGLRRPVTLV